MKNLRYSIEKVMPQKTEIIELAAQNIELALDDKNDYLASEYKQDLYIAIDEILCRIGGSSQENDVLHTLLCINKQELDFFCEFINKSIGASRIQRLIKDHDYHLDAYQVTLELEELMTERLHKRVAPYQIPKPLQKVAHKAAKDIQYKVSRRNLDIDDEMLILEGLFELLMTNRPDPSQDADTVDHDHLAEKQWLSILGESVCDLTHFDTMQANW